MAKQISPKKIEAIKKVYEQLDSLPGNVAFSDYVNGSQITLKTGIIDKVNEFDIDWNNDANNELEEDEDRAAYIERAIKKETKLVARFKRLIK